MKRTAKKTDKIKRVVANRNSNKDKTKKSNASCRTTKKVFDIEATESKIKKRDPKPNHLDEYKEILISKLKEDLQLKPRDRRKITILFEELKREGYKGNYEIVRKFVRTWHSEHENKNNAFIPLVFHKGEAFQFDWSKETVVLSKINTDIQVAHFRLCFSRMPFIRAYPCQTTEMVLDAHVHAHDFYEGLCDRGIYDNPKTIVSKIGRGRERDFNSRIVSLASHYLFEPTACTPGCANEKGQVEQQVDTLRDNIFTPRLKFKNFEELNAHLIEQCIYWAKKTKHPEYTDKTIWEVYQEEKPYLRSQKRPFEAYSSAIRRVSPTCYAVHDRNYYSVPCKYANTVVEVRIYADKIVIAHDGKAIAEHQRFFDHGHYSTKMEHYLPLLNKKPGAVRNGRPFVDENLPETFVRLRDVLGRSHRGEREFAHILMTIGTYGYDIILKATEMMLKAGCANETTILNAASRLADKKTPKNIKVPKNLILTCEPEANCSQYDALLGD